MPINRSTDVLSFERDGAQRYYSVFDENEVKKIIIALSDSPKNRAGIRLTGIAALNNFISATGKVGKLARRLIGRKARPVRAILFDKNSATNWGLKWHQDRTIVVERRIETAEYGPWTTKSGLQHVAPPFDLLSQMVTARIHLDKVDIDNAPLLIAPGSHRLGLVPEPKIRKAVAECGTFSCLADAGDVWLYSTPIIHSSKAAKKPEHRRVLQVDYSAAELPNGLKWLGF